MKKLNPEARKLIRHIERYVEARIAKSWKGAKSPEEWLEIDEELEASRNDLFARIRILTEGGLKSR